MRRRIDPIIVVPYNPAWRAMFRALAAPLRTALGDIAVRIDHMGLTTVPGLAATPIIGIQITVESFESFDAIPLPLRRCGFHSHAGLFERIKRAF